MRAPLQFVLDFFTGGDPVVSASGRAPMPLTTQPVAQAQDVDLTPHRAAPSLAPGLAHDERVPAVLGFTHPAANRHAQLQGVTVSYRFERSRRKSIGFLVGPMVWWCVRPTG